MKKQFELSQTAGVPVSTEDLLQDVKRVASQLPSKTTTYRQYQQLGKYSSQTVRTRFGSWNRALQEAGLQISNEMSIPDERLFENIEQLWIKLGRQPRKRDLASSSSEYSERPYTRRFGSWWKALEEFVEYVNSQEAAERATSYTLSPEKSKRRTSRDPSLRLRFLVMRRDSFKCQHCGKSPATHQNIELEVDHIIAWSKGGETTLDNLRTLCSHCNLGKANLTESAAG
jgi:hypothetical protein